MKLCIYIKLFDAHGGPKRKSTRKRIETVRFQVAVPATSEGPKRKSTRKRIETGYRSNVSISITDARNGNPPEKGLKPVPATSEVIQLSARNGNPPEKGLKH